MSSLRAKKKVDKLYQSCLLIKDLLIFSFHRQQQKRETASISDTNRQLKITSMLLR